MRVVVVGATGNVGTSVVEALVDDDRIEEVVGIARRLPDWSRSKVRFVAADVAEDPLTPHFDGADAVVHLAWLFQPTHRPAVTWRTNAGGSIRVLDAVQESGVAALVHASSVGAYSPGPDDGSAVDESWPTHSLQSAAYGREKAYLERLLDIFERDHPDRRVVRLRPAFTFKRESATSQRRLFLGPFVPRGLLRPGRVPVLPLPDGLRFQALHSSDVADAYLRAVTSDARGAFNVAADDDVDGPALAGILGARHLALDLPLMDTGRVRSELGWAPRRSGREAIAELLEGIADGAGGPTSPLAPDGAGGRAVEMASGVGERP